jgi:hypothetical protein
MTTTLMIAIPITWYLVGFLVFYIAYRKTFCIFGPDWWIGACTALCGPLLILGLAVLNAKKTLRILGNLLVAPFILAFKLFRFAIFAVMVLNLWFELPGLLGWLIAANLAMEAYFIYAMRTRNKNFKYAAVQTHILNSRLKVYERVRTRELDPTPEDNEEILP